MCSRSWQAAGVRILLHRARHLESLLQNRNEQPTALWSLQGRTKNGFGVSAVVEAAGGLNEHFMETRLRRALDDWVHSGSLLCGGHYLQDTAFQQPPQLLLLKPRDSVRTLFFVFVVGGTGGGPSPRVAACWSKGTAGAPSLYRLIERALRLPLGDKILIRFEQGALASFLCTLCRFSEGIFKHIHVCGITNLFCRQDE